MPREFGVPDEIIRGVLKKELPVSAYSEYMKPIHDKHVIGINSAFLIGDWIDIVFFGDRGWFLSNREALAKFPGIKVSCSPHTNRKEYDAENVKTVARSRTGRGISNERNSVAWNSNSGAAAISLAYHLGAKRVILLGFDMKLDESGYQHWHQLYKTAGDRRPAKRLPFGRHLIGFAQIAKDAKRFNMEIINASPDSAIKELPKTSVKDLLNGEFKPEEPEKKKYRRNFLNEMIKKHKFTTGAEIGVHRGRLTRFLLLKNKELTMYAIDLWGRNYRVMSENERDRRKRENQRAIYRDFHNATRSFRNRVKVLRGISWNMADNIKDGSLDFIFVDADHAEDSFRNDLKAWIPKVKETGLISGHDYSFPGVNKVITEMIPNVSLAGYDDVWYIFKKDLQWI